MVNEACIIKKGPSGHDLREGEDANTLFSRVIGHIRAWVTDNKTQKQRNGKGGGLRGCGM